MQITKNLIFNQTQIEEYPETQNLVVILKIHLSLPHKTNDKNRSQQCTVNVNTHICTQHER